MEPWRAAGAHNGDMGVKNGAEEGMQAQRSEIMGSRIRIKIQISIRVKSPIRIPIRI
jgi:hypothetical protein